MRNSAQNLSGVVHSFQDTRSVLIGDKVSTIGGYTLAHASGFQWAQSHILVTWVQRGILDCTEEFPGIRKRLIGCVSSDFDITNPEFTLQSLIDLNAVQFQEDITAIST